MFGQTHTAVTPAPSLAATGRKQLYSSTAPPLSELRRLNAALLASFRALLETLCTPETPSDAHTAAVRDIEDALVNMQHLVNALRPRQAALLLAGLLSRQTAARRGMAHRLRDAVRRAWELVGAAAERLSERGLPAPPAIAPRLPAVCAPAAEMVDPLPALLAKVAAVANDEML